MERLIKTISKAVLFLTALWFMNAVSLDSIYGIVPIVFFVAMVVAAFINYYKDVKTKKAS